MASKNSKTGLGKNVFFRNSETNGQEADETNANASEKAGEGAEQEQGSNSEAANNESAKPKKVRTTVTLYPDTLAAMELLKVESRKKGQRATYSDVLGEAIALLMEQKGLSV